ncbi:MAG: hypothetical protein IKH16_04340 [Selenomonadaceae bacterium]|nr:hypothetical protein [Selenomonadaceae bacterium]
MEQTISGDTPTTKEPTKHHLTLEEQLAQLEAKEKKAKETEARRKTKMAKLRSALLAQKREVFDNVLSEHGIQTESQLREALALHAKLIGSGITTPGQLDKLIDLALQYDPDIIDGLTEENRQSEQGNAM